MSLLSSLGIPPGDGLLGEIIQDDDKVREELGQSACPDCDGRDYRRVYRQLSSFERWYTPCPTCEGTGKHTVAGAQG